MTKSPKNAALELRVPLLAQVIYGACIPPSCSFPLVSPLFLTPPPLQPTFFSSTSTFLPSRHSWWLSLSSGCFLQMKVISWAHPYLSCQNLSLGLPGALGDHVVPSPTFSVFQFFLLFFSWKWMVQGVRVLKKMYIYKIYWM